MLLRVRIDDRIFVLFLHRDDIYLVTHPTLNPSYFILHGDPSKGAPPSHIHFLTPILSPFLFKFAVSPLTIQKVHLHEIKLVALSRLKNNNNNNKLPLPLFFLLFPENKQGYIKSAKPPDGQN